MTSAPACADHIYTCVQKIEEIEPGKFYSYYTIECRVCKKTEKYNKEKHIRIFNVNRATFTCTDVTCPAFFGEKCKYGYGFHKLSKEQQAKIDEKIEERRISRELERENAERRRREFDEKTKHMKPIIEALEEFGYKPYVFSFEDTIEIMEMLYPGYIKDKFNDSDDKPIRKFIEFCIRYFSKIRYTSSKAPPKSKESVSYISDEDESSSSDEDEYPHRLLRKEKFEKKFYYNNCYCIEHDPSMYFSEDCSEGAAEGTGDDSSPVVSKEYIEELNRFKTERKKNIKPILKKMNKILANFSDIEKNIERLKSIIANVNKHFEDYYCSFENAYSDTIKARFYFYYILTYYKFNKCL